MLDTFSMLPWFQLLYEIPKQFGCIIHCTWRMMLEKVGLNACSSALKMNVARLVSNSTVVKHGDNARATGR